MGDGQIEFILPCLRENISKGGVGEALKLVDVEIEVRRLLELFTGEVCSTHSRQINTSGEHGAEQVGIALPHQTFGKIGNNNFLAVHQLTQIEARLGLANDVPDEWVAGELTDLVLNGVTRLLHVPFVVVGKLIFPERLNRRIGDVINHRFAVVLIREHPVHPKESRVRVLKECQKGVREDVLHSGAPSVDPNLLKHGHQARHNQVAPVCPNVFHNVERNWMVSIKRSKVEHVVHSVFRDVVEDGFGG